MKVLEVEGARAPVPYSWRRHCSRKCMKRLPTAAFIFTSMSAFIVTSLSQVTALASTECSCRTLRVITVSTPTVAANTLHYITIFLRWPKYITARTTMVRTTTNKLHNHNHNHNEVFV